MLSEVAQNVLRRDRVVVLSGLALIAALSWAYVSSLVPDTQNMNMEGMGTQMNTLRMQAWGPADFVLMFGMWEVMMVAMMTPSAAPLINMFEGINCRRGDYVA